MRRLMLLSVAALISFLAVAARTEKSTVAASFSDREIFEGVVFGVGPVAQLVPEAREQLRPEIYARNADELASMAQVRASLLASIERAEPGLVGEFARVARSGDPAAIRSMLERATEAVNAAAEEESGGLDGTLVANIPNPNPRQRPPPVRVPRRSCSRTRRSRKHPEPQPAAAPRPGPRPTPQLQQDAPLFANIPNPNPRQRPPPVRVPRRSCSRTRRSSQTSRTPTRGSARARVRAPRRSCSRTRRSSQTSRTPTRGSAPARVRAPRRSCSRTHRSSQTSRTPTRGSARPGSASDSAAHRATARCTAGVGPVQLAAVHGAAGRLDGTRARAHRGLTVRPGQMARLLAAAIVCLFALNWLESPLRAPAGRRLQLLAVAPQFWGYFASPLQDRLELFRLRGATWVRADFPLGAAEESPRPRTRTGGAQLGAPCASEGRLARMVGGDGSRR